MNEVEIEFFYAVEKDDLAKVNEIANLWIKRHISKLEMITTCDGIEKVFAIAASKIYAESEYELLENYEKEIYNLIQKATVTVVTVPLPQNDKSSNVKSGFGFSKLDFVRKQILEREPNNGTLMIDSAIRSVISSAAILKHGGFNKEDMLDAQNNLDNNRNWIKGYLYGLYQTGLISYSAMVVAERDVRKIISNVKGTWEEINNE